MNRDCTGHVRPKLSIFPPDFRYSFYKGTIHDEEDCICDQQRA